MPNVFHEQKQDIKMLHCNNGETVISKTHQIETATKYDANNTGLQLQELDGEKCACLS